MRKNYTKQWLTDNPDANQLLYEHLGSSSMVPFPGAVSGARLGMSGGQSKQIVVTVGNEPSVVQTGIEKEYGKYTFSIRMPKSGTITRIIPIQDGHDQVEKVNLVIYEIDGKSDGGGMYARNAVRLGSFILRGWCSNHTSFGYRYKPTKHLHELRPGAHFEKDTVFYDSPNVQGDEYANGIPTNLCLITDPGTSEDGAVVSDRYLEKLAYYVYESVTVMLDSDEYLLDLYNKTGKPEHYQPFPAVGQLVGEDGILVAMRNLKDLLDTPTLGSNKASRRPNTTFDRCINLRGPGQEVLVDGVKVSSGRVVASEVYFDEMAPTIAPETENFVRNAAAGRKNYLQTLLNYYREMTKKVAQVGRVLEMEPALTQLVARAMAEVERTKIPRIEGLKTTGTNTKFIFRQNRVGRVLMRFTVEYVVKPGLGYKIADRYAAKSVIVEIRPWQHMPRDKFGRYADVLQAPNGTVSRQNPGRLYEGTLGQAAVETSVKLRRQFGWDETKTGQKYVPSVLMHLNKFTQAEITKAADHIAGLYGVISPALFSLYEKGLWGVDKKQLVAECIATDLSPVVTIDEQKPYEEEALDLRSSVYNPTFDVLTYVDYTGKEVTTLTPVRIMRSTMHLLGKTPEEGNACAIPSMTVRGVPASPSRSEAQQNNFRETATRGTGESEFRAAAADCGPKVAAELLDRSTNPRTVADMSDTLVRHHHPTNIEVLVDRDKIPLGHSAPLTLVNHTLACFGTRIVYEPFDNTKNVFGEPIAKEGAPA
jgi:RNA polymerase Rpb2, domain 6